MTQVEENSKYDIAVVSDEAEVVRRITNISKDFGFTFLHWPSLDEFLEKSKASYKLVLSSLTTFQTAESVAELAQGVRHVVQDQPVVLCCVPKSVDKEAAQFVKKSGANIILIRDEVTTTCKLEFVALQTIHSSFLPVKSSDLLSGTALSFELYHLLPQRGKFIKFAVRDQALTDTKLAKLDEVGEIYIHREDAAAFNAFVASRNDKSAAGLARRCRAQYLALHASFSSLILLLTDQSEGGSFAEGQRLLKVCQDMCDALLGLLGERGQAWEVVNNSAIGELGSVERGPAIAAYAGLMGLQMGLANLNQIMLAALLADLGLVLLSPEIGKLVREGRLEDLNDEQLAQYRNYPNMSLDLALNRKLALDEKFRALMIATNERADTKGFPKGLNPDKIPTGAQLVQFCRDLDRRTLLRMGKARPRRELVLQAMFDEDAAANKRYTREFWSLLKEAKIVGNV